MVEPSLENQYRGQTDQARKRAIAPLIALLSSLSPFYLSVLILIVALVFSSAFEPPPGYSSALYSPNMVYLFALGLPAVILVPLGLILGLVSIVRERRSGDSMGHPMAWGAILISGMCLIFGCVSTIIPGLFMQFIP